jgi:hypothetical protein
MKSHWPLDALLPLLHACFPVVFQQSSSDHFQPNLTDWEQKQKRNIYAGAGLVTHRGAMEEQARTTVTLAEKLRQGRGRT